jgi:hypothetical protein
VARMSVFDQLVDGLMLFLPQYKSMHQTLK